MFVLALLMCQCPAPIPAEAEVSKVATLVAGLKGKDRKARWKAIDQLCKMGPDAADAIPDLIELMDEQDEAMRFGYHSVLRDIGPKSVPPLVRALGSREPARRRHVAEALEDMARFPKTKPLVAPLVPTLTEVAVGDSDHGARLAATAAINYVGGKEAVTALLTILKQDDDEVRLCAAEGLGALGPLAKPAVPAFLKLMDEHGEIQVAATQGLLNIGDAEAAAGLSKLLCDASKGSLTRRASAGALAGMPSQAAIAVPALIRACQDADPEVREQVANSLQELGTDARDAAPALRKMLSDNAPMVRVAAAAALCAVGGPDDEAVRSLVKDSRDPDIGARAWAVYTLGKVGKNEKSAVDAMVAGLGDEEPYVRVAAAEGLEAAGQPAAAKAIPALEKLLDDPSPKVREAAKQALSSLTSK